MKQDQDGCVDTALTVRAYRPEDLADCALCMIEGFFTSEPTPEIVDFFRDYVYLLAGKSSFTLVAECGGEVVGFICAEYQKSFSPALAKKTLSPVTGAYLKWMLKYYTGRYHLPAGFQREFRLFLRLAQNMRGRELGTCDCELSALTSRRAWRRGLGTVLADALMERCRVAGARSVRLFTNTDASYRFYDRYGFSLLGEKPFAGAGHGGTSFLYEYRLQR